MLCPSRDFCVSTAVWDRLDRTREFGQQRIAGRVDHAAAAAHHQAGDDIAIDLEGLNSCGLVGCHQTGIADRAE